MLSATSSGAARSVSVAAASLTTLAPFAVSEASFEGAGSVACSATASTGIAVSSDSRASRAAALSCARRVLGVARNARTLVTEPQSM